MVVVTAQPGRCCCANLYSERGGASSYYCPEGNRLLCEECATNGAGLCPTHRVLCTSWATPYGRARRDRSAVEHGSKRLRQMAVDKSVPVHPFSD